MSRDFDGLLCALPAAAARAKVSKNANVLRIWVLLLSIRFGLQRPPPAGGFQPSFDGPFWKNCASLLNGPVAYFELAWPKIFPARSTKQTGVLPGVPDAQLR